MIADLVNLYDALAEKGLIAKLGWAQAKVSFALEIDDDGTPLALYPLKTPHPKNEKKLMPAMKTVPVQPRRSTGANPFFLCDNAKYVFGHDPQAKAENAAMEKFKSCEALIKKVLKDINTPPAKAVKAYHSKWDIKNDISTHSLTAEFIKDIELGGNIIFLHNGVEVHEYPEIASAWDNYYANQSDSSEKDTRICLVSGKREPIAATHLAIKGLDNGMGCPLVSFKPQSSESYGQTQGYNAPISSVAAFKYATALNYMVGNPEFSIKYADATGVAKSTILFWAEGAEPGYQQLLGLGSSFAFTADDDDTNYRLTDYIAAMRKIVKGQKVEWEGMTLDPETKTFMLILSPNVARIVVKEFRSARFADILAGACAHYERLEIAHSSSIKRWPMSPYELLRETTYITDKSTGSRDIKNVHPKLIDQFIISVFKNELYPPQIIADIMRRIKAEKEVTARKASIIKAYYLKNKHQQFPEEVLTVSLNRESNHTPYVLGRLYSVIESLQEDAMNTKTTVEKYFSTASTNPAAAFPMLIKGAHIHIKKLNTGHGISYSKRIQDLIGRLPEFFPTYLTSAEQGAFYVGYYHEKQMRFTKKEDLPENTTEEIKEI